MKQKVMKLHRHLVRHGNYTVARKILTFLKMGKIKLYFNDTDWAVDNYLTDLGYTAFIDCRGYASYSILRYTI